MIGAASDEAYVEAELDLPDDEVLGELAELRPEGEETLVLARRIFADGRTRAYAWGRSAAREDVAAAVEALLAMSGQFEQRRLARPSYQLATLDAFAGTADHARAARRAWRELTAARRAHDELTRDAAAAEARLEELRALAEDTEGLEPGRGGRAASRAGAAAPRHRAGARRGDRARGARRRRARWRRRPRRRGRARRGAARGDRARAGLGRRERFAPPELALREVAIDLRRFLDSLEAEPGPARGGREPPRPDRRPAPPLRCRHLRRAARDGRGRRAPSSTRSPRGTTLPGQRPRRSLPRQAEVDRLHAELRAARREAAPRFAEAVAAELVGVGLGEGEFRVDVREADPGPVGRRRGRLLGPTERRPALRAGRRDRLRRRALAHRARDRRGRRRRDDGLRRDRRRDRRPDRARSRRDAPPARRPGPGDHDHAPAADREPRRPPLPRREGPRRPDAHADRAARRRRAPRGARAHARRRRVPRHARRE